METTAQNKRKYLIYLIIMILISNKTVSLGNVQNCEKYLDNFYSSLIFISKLNSCIICGHLLR